MSACPPNVKPPEPYHKTHQVISSTVWIAERSSMRLRLWRLPVPVSISSRFQPIFTQSLHSRYSHFLVAFHTHVLFRICNTLKSVYQHECGSFHILSAFVIHSRCIWIDIYIKLELQSSSSLFAGLLNICKRMSVGWEKEITLSWLTRLFFLRQLLWNAVINKKLIIIINCSG